jgi:hypothetical protein
MPSCAIAGAAETPANTKAAKIKIVRIVILPILKLVAFTNRQSPVTLNSAVA